MNAWILYIFVSSVMAMMLALFIIPRIRFIAFSKKLFDIPDERKIHTAQIPRLGGFAFTPILIFVLFFVLGLGSTTDSGFVLQEFLSNCAEISFGFCAVMLLYVIGLADDLIGVRYWAKFTTQFIGAAFVIFGGMGVRQLYGVLYLQFVPFPVEIFLTILMVVFVINAINFIDGMDGLASGLCIVALAVYGIAFYCFDLYIYSLLSFVTAGILLSFFYYNVFGSAALGKKIFMGDTGSMTVGMLVCLLGLKLLNGIPEESVSAINPFVLVFSPIMIPCLDVIRVTLNRLRKHQNPFLPDRNHIHHKLMDVGMPHNMILIILILTSGIITICNLLLTRYINVTFVIILNCLLWGVVNIYLSESIKRNI